MPATDPYAVLDVRASATDAELRAAYRRAVQRDHPDHNGGSPESARRFEEVQEAYARIRALRASAPRPTAAAPGSADPGLDARLSAMERELDAARQARVAREAREARDRARRAARTAAGDADDSARPSDEELGYVHTDDSFSKIFSDAAAGLSEQLEHARNEGTQPPDARQSAREASGAARKTAGRATHRLADLIDELGDRLTGDR